MQIYFIIWELQDNGKKGKLEAVLYFRLMCFSEKKYDFNVLFGNMNIWSKFYSILQNSFDIDFKENIYFGKEGYMVWFQEKW